MELLDSIKGYLDKKIIAVAERFFKAEEPVNLDIEVGKATKHHNKGKVFRAEVNLLVGKKMLRAESYGEDLYEAIDLLEAELENEIKKFKARIKTLIIKGARSVKEKK